MKYKIVIMNYLDETSPDVRALTSNNEWTPFHCGRQREIEKQWKNGQGWFALELYGVHIFETDDLETFDLMESQREKDKIEIAKVKSEMDNENDALMLLKSESYNEGYTQGTKDIQARINSGRKAEIRRIAEQLWIHDSNNLFKTFADTIKCARNIVDNFDTEFERLERSDKLMHYTEINSEVEK